MSAQHQHKEGGGVGRRLLPLGVLMARLNAAPWGMTEEEQTGEFSHKLTGREKMKQA